MSDLSSKFYLSLCIKFYTIVFYTALAINVEKGPYIMQPKLLPTAPLPSQEQKHLFSTWVDNLQHKICDEMNSIEKEYAQNQPEDAATSVLPAFEFKSWKRSDPLMASAVNSSGGGTMGVLRGKVLEKMGVNISVVWGEFSPEFSKQIPGADQDPRFWAAGISLVAHPKSPLIPTIHLNFRHIVTQFSWFGGGTDLTPMLMTEAEPLRERFHQHLKQNCDQHGSQHYPVFKQQCDEYFYIPHRKEMRGVGGIFFDYHNSGDWQADFAMVQTLGESFLQFYPAVIRENMYKSWTEEQRQQQLKRRGRYVEFNLLYDRGTKFGLMTGGEIDAIFVSLPPMASW